MPRVGGESNNIGFLIQMRPEPLEETLAAGGLALYAMLYLWLMRPHPIHHAAPGRRPSPHLRLALLVMTLLGLAFSVTYDHTFLWLLVGTSAVTGKTLPTRSAHWVVTVLPLLVLGMVVVLSGGLLPWTGCISFPWHFWCGPWG